MPVRLRPSGSRTREGPPRGGPPGNSTQRRLSTLIVPLWRHCGTLAQARPRLPLVESQAPPGDNHLAPDYVLTDKRAMWKWLVGALVVVVTIVLLIVAVFHDVWTTV